MISNGSCYCGQVSFSVSGELRQVYFCHCSQCRKLSGHIVAASAAAIDNITIKGEVKWFESSPNHQRGSCPNCASPLFWRDTNASTLSIMAGAFDDTVKLTGGVHIFCADKADYYEINDKLPHYNSGYTTKALATKESN